MTQFNMDMKNIKNNINDIDFTETLIRAIKKGKMEIFSFLITKKEFISNYDWIFKYTIQYKQKEMIQHLLENYNFKEKKEQLETGAKLACVEESYEILSLLMSYNVTLEKVYPNDIIDLINSDEIELLKSIFKIKKCQDINLYLEEAIFYKNPISFQIILNPFNSEVNLMDIYYSLAKSISSKILKYIEITYKSFVTEEILLKNIEKVRKSLYFEIINNNLNKHQQLMQDCIKNKLPESLAYLITLNETNDLDYLKIIHDSDFQFLIKFIKWSANHLVRTNKINLILANTLGTYCKNKEFYKFHDFIEINEIRNNIKYQDWVPCLIENDQLEIIRKIYYYKRDLLLKDIEKSIKHNSIKCFEYLVSFNLSDKIYWDYLTYQYEIKENPINYKELIKNLSKNQTSFVKVLDRLFSKYDHFELKESVFSFPYGKS